MKPQLNIEKLSSLPTTSEHLNREYGAKGTATRDTFDAKAKAWYYAEVLKDARKSARMTQQQLADRIGKKREYVSALEKGETDATIYISNDF